MVSCKSRLKERASNRVKVSFLAMAMASWLYWLWGMGKRAMAITLLLFRAKAR